MKDTDTDRDALTRQLGAALRDLDALMARYRAEREKMSPERRACLEQMLAQACHRAEQVANELALAYERAV